MDIKTQDDIAILLGEKGAKRVAPLKDLSKSPLMSQVGEYIDNPSMLEPLRLNNVPVAYRSLEADICFVLSDENIFQNTISAQIAKDMGYKDAGVLFEENEDKIDYKSRERAKELEFNGRKFKAYVDPIGHPDDQVRIRVVEDKTSPRQAQRKGRGRKP